MEWRAKYTRLGLTNIIIGMTLNLKAVGRCPELLANVSTARFTSLTRKLYVVHYEAITKVWVYVNNHHTPELIRVTTPALPNR